MAHTVPVRVAPFGFSPRQMEVAQLLAAGLSTQRIARSLQIGHRTCERLIIKVRRATDMDSRAATVALLRDILDN